MWVVGADGLVPAFSDGDGFSSRALPPIFWIGLGAIQAKHPVYLASELPAEKIGLKSG